MAFIPANPQKGDRIRIDADVRVIAGTYTKGHIFTIVENGDLGYTLRDDDGRFLYDFGRLGEPYTVLSRD